jgi:hypothetical protein
LLDTVFAVLEVLREAGPAAGEKLNWDFLDSWPAEWGVASVATALSVALRTP